MNIVNFGSLNIDHVYSVDHIATCGETIQAITCDLFPGGKGFNQSIALARSGKKIFHAGCVGKDGDSLLEYLCKNGVNVQYLAKAPLMSGHAIIQVDKHGQNSIMIYGGSNQSVTKEMVDHVLSAFQKGDILLLQNEISQVDYLIRKGHERGLSIAFNPAPFTPSILNYPLDQLDYLFVNEIEAAYIAQEVLDTPMDVVADTLEKRFPNVTTVITMGKEGAFLLQRGEKIFQPSYPTETVDTTGAGDTFIGYFLGAVSNHIPYKAAMQYAAAAASLTVSRKGAAPSIPYFDEVDAFLLQKQIR